MFTTINYKRTASMTTTKRKSTIRSSPSRTKLGLYLWDELDTGAQAAVARDLHRLLRQPPTAALPYPAAALDRYAEAIGRSGLVAAIFGSGTAYAH